MRLALATLALLVGGALTAATYWAFLNTPESTVWSIGSSALLFLMALLLAGLTINGAILVWTEGPSRGVPLRALRSAPAVVPAGVIVLAFWWLTAAAERWVAMRNGPISAWFIARFGWDDVSWLFTAVRYGAIWMRWVVAGLLATWFMAVVLSGRKHRLAARGVVLASVWFVVLVALPWMYLVPWRPAALPPTGIEMAFIIGKLTAAATMIATGAALVIREGLPEARPRPDLRLG